MGGTGTQQRQAGRQASKVSAVLPLTRGKAARLGGERLDRRQKAYP